MGIEFSNDELRKLVKALRIADWVVNSKSIEEADNDPALYALQQKIYKLAADAGLKDTVCYDFGAGVYEEHPDFDLQIFRDAIDAYDEDVFWNGLVDRLVIRALEEQYGESVREDIEKDPTYRKDEREHLAERLRTLMERDGIYALFLQPGWAMPDGLLKDPENEAFDPTRN